MSARPVPASYDFARRVAVVTGGSSGIGRDVAERLVRQNARVVVWDLAAADLPGVELSVAVDVADSAATESALRQTVDTVGPVFYLVNSAGVVGRSAPLWEAGPEEWRRVIDVNLQGVYNTCHAVIPGLLLAEGGGIVSISSITGLDGNRNYSAYSASKAALIALTQSLGKELAPHGIRANAVAPAMVDTALLHSMDAAYIAECRAKSSFGRLVNAAEITAAVLWLLSDEASFLTGYTMPIAGGRNA